MTKKLIGVAHLLKVIKANDLVVANATEKCDGLWTRQNTQRTAEHAVIDYVLCTQRAYEAIKSMQIDNKKLLHFSRYLEEARCNGIVDSDHYTITVELNINAISCDGGKKSIIKLCSTNSWQKYEQMCETINTAQFQTYTGNISAQSEYIGQHLVSTAAKYASTRQTDKRRDRNQQEPENNVEQKKKPKARTITKIIK